MGGLSTRIMGLAAGGGFVALAFVAGCNSAQSARAGDDVADAGKTVAARTGSPDAAARDPLCEAGETPFFSCAIGVKRVSVCGGGAGAVYRYGTTAKVELTSRGLTFASRQYSGGGEAQLTARNGDYAYTVYDRTVRTGFGGGGNDPAFSSGLVVTRGGRIVSARTCESEATVASDARRAVPAGSFVDH